MNITFKSEKYGDREWLNYKPQRMMSTKSEKIEAVTGLTFVQWGQSLMNGSAICGRALVWVLLLDENRGLRFKDVDFPIGDLGIELDDDEKTQIREALKTNDDISDEDRKQLLLALGEDDLDELDASLEEPADGSGNVSTATVSNTSTD